MDMQQDELKAVESDVGFGGSPVDMMEDPAERNICDSCA